MALPVQNGSVAINSSVAAVGSLPTAHTINAGLVDSMVIGFTASPQFSAATSATWNGTAMSRIAFSITNFYITAFYLANPVSGTHDFTPNWTIFAPNVAVTVVTLTGARTPINATGTSHGTSSTASGSVTTSVDDCLLLDMCMSAITTHAQGAGQTGLSNFSVGIYQASSSYIGLPSLGSGGMSVTLGASKDWELSILAVPPVPPPGPFKAQTIII